MKTANVDVNQIIQVTVDETKFTEDFMAEFRKSMFGVSNFQMFTGRAWPQEHAYKNVDAGIIWSFGLVVLFSIIGHYQSINS